ncbi:MAG: ISAzo13 family transposase [Candidatus Rokubacteria bacterium]|nr:ISAzo13 family transposase [Candidatus Rokubacteria bacterium]
MVAEAAIRRRFRLIERHLDERQRRLMAAAEVAAAGRGGVSAVARATGVSRRAIRAGAQDLRARGAAALAPGRIRRPGGGRKRTRDTDPTLVRDLEALLAPTTRGDPQSPLRWTCKSLRRLAAELTRQGHRTSHRMVAVLLRQLGYSLQANRKTIEGARHPDRNAQFEHINARVRAYLRQGEPAISVDTKKKELVGNFKNAGRDWRPRGQPQPVQVHDFVQPELGRAIPYGVYDLRANTGWVSVGIDHDTAAFAVASIRHWWRAMGQRAYPHARRLLITADAGGSNGARVRLWKVELQKLANRLRLPISVCHFPPGTSKWNKIEHRLFSFITKNWRGRPLVSHAVIVNLIAATTTPTGLRVRARLDTRRYPSGLPVSREAVEAVQLRPDAFHGDWNYTILPTPSKKR